ncbi:asparagine synthase (glutamine-hydrolyzing) [uncultured Microscilla sp.]|uniref:asparagine synthase (glutamine-hydrolyzing) n=1 Tax=uncultured Microscilla sp. TaxID=432653 RepID=UPI00260B72B6|nr:asparagine synthase (glutamine-hydrolyzing) [uncultured Microscilla sp.]
MCGLNLIVDFRGDLNIDNVQQMNAATQHRGPDGSHVEHLHLASAQVFMGHNHLKIIDLRSSNNQPFFSRDGRYVLIFNGEIYNYLQLKAALPTSYHWKTNTDTEVLLYWLITHGANGIPTLEGMFAFALLDIQQQQILLGRDASLIKPLYFYQNERCLVVSSEIRGVVASGVVPNRLNEGQVGHYLRFKYAPPPQTFYQHIYHLPLLANFDINTQKLQEIPTNTTSTYSSSPLDSQSIEELLITSIEQQLQADVPVGIFLSGGVDSTLLLSIVQELGTQHLPSFSLVNTVGDQSFGTKDFHFARLASQQYQSIHHEYTIDATDLKDLADWVACLDQPIADGAALLTYLLAKKARKQVKVILSGAGADELFAGYNRHWAFAQYLKKRPLLNTLKPYAQWLGRGLSDRGSYPWRNKIRLAQKFFDQIDIHPAQTFVNFTQLQTIPLRKQLHLTSPHIQYDTTEEWLRWCLHYDKTHYLANDVLAMTDAMSMQHGLEVRVPYLSQALTKAIQHYPTLELLKKGKKTLLKKWLNKRGGQLYTQRAKEGFGMPFGKWLQEGKLPWITNSLKKPHPVTYKWIDYPKFEKMLATHQHKKRDYTSEIWAVVVLDYWLKAKF